jgi:hypothetical protein
MKLGVESSGFGVMNPDSKVRIHYAKCGTERSREEVGFRSSRNDGLILNC